jgi:hypothetical protein
MIKTENTAPPQNPTQKAFEKELPQVNHEHVDRFKELIRKKNDNTPSASKKGKDDSSLISASKKREDDASLIDQKKTGKQEEQTHDDEGADHAQQKNANEQMVFFSARATDHHISDIQSSQFAEASSTQKATSIIQQITTRLDASGESLASGGVLSLQLSPPSLLPDTTITIAVSQGRMQIGFMTTNTDSAKWVKKHQNALMQNVRKKTGQNILLAVNGQSQKNPYE